MKIFKQVVMFTIAMICIMGSLCISAHASTYVDMGTKHGVDVQKVWTINFNDEVDRTTAASSDNIVVLDSNNNKVSISATYKDSKTIQISPSDKYEYGKTYTLIARDKIKSKQGNRYLKETRMKFITKVNPLSGTTYIKDIKDLNIVLYKGQKYTFPSSVRATMSDNTEKNVSIKWNSTSLDTYKSGEYSYIGTVEGYSEKVKLNINVDSSSSIDISKVNNICIDPAGASNLKGLVGPTGVKSEDVNLAIAKKIGNILKNSGKNVIYTRESQSVSWSESEDEQKRDSIANALGAQLLISINSNYYTSQTAEGAETYYLSSDNTGRNLAQEIQKNMIFNTGLKDRGVSEIGQNHIEFLRGFNGSGVMVYPGFISNPKEEKLLNTEAYQEKVAKSIANSILNYSEKSNEITSVNNITVNLNQGSSYKLPTTVSATDGNGNSIKANVTWTTNTIDTNSVGTHVIKGKVENYDGLVTLTLVIKGKSTAKYKICIDPGHGGYDSGAVGPNGIMEKNVVLKTALKVGDILTKNGVEVVYTRTSDKTPWPADKNKELAMRCSISDAANVDYFISIHANSADTSSAYGIETFYGNNRSDGIELARNIQRELVAATGGRDRGAKSSPFYVTKHPKAPCVLVELEFLSNPQKEALLNTDSYQQKCAQGIARGIMDTLNSK